ncbi:C4-type zinc-finger of DNA polymerase delta [Penicillium longicatenatum]|uniref:C4-type zinc-finger of DNA polymerase delta n=1 Tax=Penicillium longicatenatum TaxID=1561947 RepID=UPI0025483D27|nr:C4-type zinc-finger of DNA polymerase delta [Penicillium longicatenatum]KAJ5639520.1 C4-type zinc-finger of DNA polymerase delta [Penicillium longicatenatum]
MDPFRVRLNCIDHYQATASELDPPLPCRDGASAKNYQPRVPVIRVFGATETGQRVCVHVHGAFPYLYIEYNGSLETEAVNSAIQTLHLSIDHVLAVSYRRNAYDQKTAYVAHVTLVKGIPFYGYHVGYRFFFKIYLLNPFYITRLADLLHQGAVMKRPLQPYESHMQYVPQWMCDYNLYGCNYMDCSKVKFRAPVPEYLELNNLEHRWHDRSIDPESIIDDPALGKQSHCALEADVCVQDILNRLDVKERPLHHDFTEMLQPVAFNERLVPSVAGLWQDETKRRKKRMGIIDPNSSPFGPEDLISMSADPRNKSKGGWIHEDEFREMADQIAADEKHRDNEKDICFDTILSTDKHAANIKTALSSVEDFFPQKFGQSTFHGQPSKSDGLPRISVDEEVALFTQSKRSREHDQVDNAFEIGVEEENSQTKRNMLEESFYDGVFDDVVNVEDPTSHEVAQPELDSRTNGDPTKHSSSLSSEEYQEAGLEGTKESQNILKRRSEEHVFPDRSSVKKPRFWSIYEPPQSSRKPIDRGKIEDEEHTEAPRKPVSASSEPKSSSSQRTIRAKAQNPITRLNYPVVKDPNDPLTILRFSQSQNDSQFSKKASQSSQHMPSSLPSSSATRDAGNNKDLSNNNEKAFSSLTGSSSTVVGIPALNSHIAGLKENLADSFEFLPDKALCLFKLAGPGSNDVISTMDVYGRPPVVYQKAYYSDETDVPERPRQYAGREFRLESNTIHFLPHFDPSGSLPAMSGEQCPITLDREQQETADRRLRQSCTIREWEFAPVPPSRAEVIEWLEQHEQSHDVTLTVNSLPPEPKPELLSQIEGPTQNRHGFKYSQKTKKTSVEHQIQYMSTMSLEVHVNTRGQLSANPAEDEISCIFWCVQSEDVDIEVNSHLPGVHVGIVYQGEGERPEAKVSKALKIDMEHEPTELDLINRLIDIVREHDPDIITGYEVHNGSWGYVIERARKKYDFELCDEISRVKAQAHGKFGKEDDRWGHGHTSSIKVTGRHMINIWRAMSGELNLLQYTMENVVFHLLHRRIPHYSHKDLTKWYRSERPRDILKVLDYFTSRVQMNLEILEANELVPRTSEQARLLGIDFSSVYYRGSQFKVESLMFRIAKPENYLLVSPSRRQVGQQNALECLPLVMEPQSDFYTSPLVVLDFQSLYPSVMIAYNYCYSTFLGRASSWRGRDKMGFLDYERQPRLLELLKDKINISPNGMMYAKQEVRQSLLAKMLTEILETRVMVKTGMKADKDDRNLQRLLNNRQLALKLIANVTYGYTSASFSGRMPCSEIADSIVQSGRETLEKAIAFIHSIERWGAEVVYGDTDSLFVYLKGRTRDQAFDIGEEIAQAVTDMNPRPIKLKFEKVYHPCVLLAKKRYVGFKYEHRNQTEPEFDAKGIETVRRDGTPAEQKIEEKALKILFRTADLSQVKSYFQRQCTKIMQGRVSIQDFCFAKEVKLGSYSERGTLPAGAMISTKRMIDDPRLEPQTGERVPYVVITGAPGSRLVDRCVGPETLLQDAQLDLDAEYYISKNIIPPLERIFNLVGANVRQWYDEMPKVQRIRRVDTSKETKIMKRTLESYMRSSSCVVCRAKLDDANGSLCEECLRHPHLTLLGVVSRLQRAEKRVVDLEAVCRSCMGVSAVDEVSCDSLDCPVFYSRTRDAANWRHSKTVLEPVVELLENKGEEGLDW